MGGFKAWIHGLISAIIGGAAMAVFTTLSLPDNQLPIESVVKIAGMGALLFASGYLKQSPLPSKE